MRHHPLLPLVCSVISWIRILRSQPSGAVGLLSNHDGLAYKIQYFETAESKLSAISTAIKQDTSVTSYVIV